MLLDVFTGQFGGIFSTGFHYAGLVISSVRMVILPGFLSGSEIMLVMTSSID
jgi:hypothetical protein